MKNFVFSASMILISISSSSFALDGSRAPLYVLVHGANFSAASWKWVRADLAKSGFKSVAPQLYGPTERLDLLTASSRLCAVLASLGSPAVVVAHSQGGAIATEAAALCGQDFRSLIYVAAVVPQSGTGVFDQLSDADNASYAECAVLDHNSDSYVLKDPGACRRVFFSDAPSSLTDMYFSTMESEPAGIGESRASYPAAMLTPIPRYYIETTKDQIVSLGTQEKIIAQAHLSEIFPIESSHTPFFWKHGELSSLLEKISE